MQEAAAVASPDERRGNVVKAFIVVADGHEGSDELADEIKAFVRDRLSAYAYPRRIEFVTDLPKTLTGKIRRIELREREREAAGDVSVTRVGIVGAGFMGSGIAESAARAGVDVDAARARAGAAGPLEGRASSSRSRAR